MKLPGILVVSVSLLTSAPGRTVIITNKPAVRNRGNAAIIGS